MLDNNQALSSLHKRIVDLEKFTEEEVKPFIRVTENNLKEVNQEIITINEDIKTVKTEQQDQSRRVKEQIKQLEAAIYRISFKDMFMIAVIVFLIMYILIKVII